MQFVKLGRSGLIVSKICLGSRRFGISRNRGTSYEDASRIIDEAFDSGINFIDTADIYSGGESEKAIGKAVSRYRDKVVIATKFKIRSEDGPNGEGASRHRIFKQVNESLKRLNTDYIDLYQVHRPDPLTHIDETLRALDDLVHQGKIRYLGCSNFDAWRIMESLWVSDKMNLERFISNQPKYNILDRYIEQEILPVSIQFGLATLAYSPAEDGFISEKTLEKLATLNEENQGKYRQVKLLKEIADKYNINLYGLSLTWLLNREETIIPIIGVTKIDHLRSNLKMIDVKLYKDDLAKIELISPTPHIDFSK